MVINSPQPVPPSDVVIKLPQDHYCHPDAPTEWWWHIGTLVSGDRVFGFEVNAASFAPIGLTQIMISDIAADKHYQSSAEHTPGEWAETDPTKPWYARLGNPELDHSWVWMTAAGADPLQGMSVKAEALDDATGTRILFDLTVAQQGPPLIVWGCGVTPYPEQPGGVTTNNFYYSLTRLATTGEIAIGDEVFPVTGTTWMDHEYGFFGSAAKPVTWFLQAMQLDNGVHISHYVSFDGSPPALDQPTPSNATVQFPDGTTYYCNQTCTLTPVGETWTSPDGKVFFLEFQVSIPDFDAEFTVKSLMADQDFPTFGNDVYEGVASAAGTFGGEAVTGTAWNEQRP